MFNLKIVTTLTVSSMAFASSMASTNLQNSKNVDPILSSIENDLNKEIKKLNIKNVKDVIKENEIAFSKSKVTKHVVPEKLSIKNTPKNIEINNQDEFKLKKIENEKINISKIEFKEFTFKEEIESKQDDSDLMVFDYNKNKSDVDKKLYERPLSNTVKNVIRREMASMPNSIMDISAKNSKFYNESIVKGIKSKNLALKQDSSLGKLGELESEDQIVFDYSSVKKKEIKLSKSNFLASSDSEEVQVSIAANEVDLDKKHVNKVNNFDFEPDYDRNDRFSDKGSGKINLSLLSRNSNSIISGLVSTVGSMNTRIELMTNSHDIQIPLFTIESFSNLISKNNIDIENAILLVKDENIKDIEIDSTYGAKLKLDENFNSVEENEKYIMFLGVKPGNTFLKFTGDEYSAQKIVYIGENEIFYEETILNNGSRKMFELMTRSLLSSNLKELNISNNDVKLLGTNKISKKFGLNGYEVLVPGEIQGARTYLEVKSENDIFVGTNGEGKIEIPSKDFTTKIIEEFKQHDLKNKCLVQLNLNQEIESIKTRGLNDKGEMFTETMFLDSDGKLSAEENESTEKAFILGEGEGQIAVHVEYADGSEENLKTLCANDTFLIEELN